MEIPPKVMEFHGIFMGNFQSWLLSENKSWMIWGGSLELEENQESDITVGPTLGPSFSSMEITIQDTPQPFSRPNNWAFLDLQAQQHPHWQQKKTVLVSLDMN